MSEPTPAKLNRLQSRAARSLARARPSPRTFQKVRRNSRHRGERERAFWRPVDPLHARALVEAAKLEEVATKEKGRRNGALGATGVRLLEVFVAIVDWRDGTLEPSYRYLQEKTGLSIDAIWKALKRLRDRGFIEWIRRTQPVEDDGTGRTVEQIENAYRLLVPDSWRDRVRMRVEQWRERAVRAAQRWRDDGDEEAARRQHIHQEKLRKTRAWAETSIEDPALRADFLASLEGEVAIPPGGEKPHQQ